MTVTSTYCLVDKELTCVVVAVYNLAQGRGPIIGDSVAIPEPFMSHIDATYKNQVCFYANLICTINLYNVVCFTIFQKFHYPCIRINLPLTMIVNKKCLTTECVSQPKFFSQQF